MRGQIPVALLAIMFGALEIAGGTQELVYLGILHSQTEPLIVGTFGTVAGVLLLAAGIALLLSSRRITVLAPAAAYVSVPVFVLIGVVKHYAAWPMTTVGLVFPVFLLFFCQRIGKSNSLVSKA